MLNRERLLELVREKRGFEVTLGFRGDVDHFIGGTDRKLWYFVKAGAKEDYYVCTLGGAEPTDVHFTRKKKSLTAEPAPQGKTVELILSELAVGQKEIGESGRKPVAVEVCGQPCSHYAFAFGERAYKIADDFGITVEYSNLKDEQAGFRLRRIVTGESVRAPAEA